MKGLFWGEFGDFLAAKSVQHPTDLRNQALTSFQLFFIDIF